MTDIAARTQMQVVHVDYPLAPEHAFLKQLMRFLTFIKHYWYKVSNPKILLFRGILVVPISLWHCAYD
jgi:hypothetical protein